MIDESIDKSIALFTLVVVPKQSINSSEVLNVSFKITKLEVYSKDEIIQL